MLEMGLQYNLSKASFSNFFHSASHTKLNTVAVSPPEVDGAKPLLDAEAPDIEVSFYYSAYSVLVFCTKYFY